MLQVLDVATLLRLLDAPPDAVYQSIERGGWTGCVWPGHPEWAMHEACIQIRSLALHYFTERYPEAMPQRYETASQLLASQGCPQGGANHLDMDPLVDQVLVWLWALAGGPTTPRAPVTAAHALQAPTVTLPLPGGDPAAFTTVGLAVLEALCFMEVAQAQQAAETFLQAQTDTLARRALQLVEALTRQDTQERVEVGIVCVDCGAQDLEMWYTGQTWGETLCMSCYEARVVQGQARAEEL